MPDPAPSLDIEDARLAFGGEVLFDGLELSLIGASITCLLGPSGVGKSSLLRMLAGLEHGASGKVTASDGGAVAPRISYMAQQDLLLPWLTLLENVMLGGRLRRQPQSRERAEEILKNLLLFDHLDKRPAQLSGGMRQRAALARTLLEDRPIVLMDEPFSALDAVTRQDLQAMTRSLLQDKTVLMVTHDPLEAARMADRLLVMAGQPVFLQEVKEVDNLRSIDPNDPKIFEKQAELMRLLEAARLNK